MVWRSCRFFLIILLIYSLIAGTVSADEVPIGHVITADAVNSVNPDNIRKTIYELQENVSLEPPHTAYKSRYCLRVRETDDPSDDACDNAADYIFDKFEDYGLSVEYDPFPHSIPGQGHYQMRNVIATLPGTGVQDQEVFVICAHYDSIADRSANWPLNWKTMPAPGASDNASGVAVVLEAARILSRYSFSSTIRFNTFSGEELSMLGSKHYAGLAAKAGEEITGVLNFDAVAYDPDIPDIDIYINLDSEWLADVLLSVREEYDIGSLILSKVVEPDMLYSDHAPFWQNGYSAIFCTGGSGPFKHTVEDIVDSLNIEMATEVTQLAIATLASLADPLDTAIQIASPEKIPITWGKIKAQY